MFSKPSGVLFNKLGEFYFEDPFKRTFWAFSIKRTCWNVIELLTSKAINESGFCGITTVNNRSNLLNNFFSNLVS